MIKKCKKKYIFETVFVKKLCKNDKRKGIAFIVVFVVLVLPNKLASEKIIPFVIY